MKAPSLDSERPAVRRHAGRWSVGVALLLGLGWIPDAAAQEVPDPVALPELRAELMDRRDQDQRLRREMVRQMNSEAGVDSVFGARVVAMDRDNADRLREILEEHGWPGWSLVGADGSRAAWVLAQHADHDRPLQKRALELLARAVENDDASGRDLAFLTDRVRKAEGRPQLYGTQTEVVDCQRVAYRIEDPEGVDARRAALGLEPLAEYLDMRRRQLGVGPGCETGAAGDEDGDPPPGPPEG